MTQEPTQEPTQQPTQAERPGATALSADEVAAYLADVFPEMSATFEIEALAPLSARLRFPIDASHLRPGGSVSGPTLFTAADLAFYVATLAMIGRQAMAVTATMTINFLRRPPLADVIAEARILKLGRTLATGDVLLHSTAVEGPVAHATASYALPRDWR